MHQTVHNWHVVLSTFFYQTVLSIVFLQLWDVANCCSIAGQDAGEGCRSGFCSNKENCRMGLSVLKSQKNISREFACFWFASKTKMISDPGFVGIEQHASGSTWENHATEDWVLEARIHTTTTNSWYWHSNQSSKKPLPSTHTICLTVLVIAIQRAQEELGTGIQRRRRTIHSCCCWDILFCHCWFCVLLQEAP